MGEKNNLVYFKKIEKKPKSFLEKKEKEQAENRMSKGKLEGFDTGTEG